MLDIQVKIEGEKVVISNLQGFTKEIPQAIDRGLNRIAKGVHREAYAWLSGPGSKASIKKGVAGSGAGSYPVPVRTGHLRRSLDWLKPGETKSGEAGTFTAGQHEVVIYDSAEYALAIHEGRLTTRQGVNYSPIYGKRPFLTDALEKFNKGDRIAKTIEEEIQKEIEKRGLK